MPDVAKSNQWEQQVAAARKACGSNVTRHHSAIEVCGRKTLAHAYCIGATLRDAKAETKHGQWADYCAELPFGRKMAAHYMRFATVVDDSTDEQKANALAISGGVTDAIKALAPPKPKPDPDARTQGDATDQQATTQAQAEVVATTEAARPSTEAPVAPPTPPPPTDPDEHGDYLLEELVSHLQSLEGTDRRSFVFDLVEILKTESPESFTPGRHYLDVEVVAAE